MAKPAQLWRHGAAAPVVTQRLWTDVLSSCNVDKEPCRPTHWQGIQCAHHKTRTNISRTSLGRVPHAASDAGALVVPDSAVRPAQARRQLEGQRVATQAECQAELTTGSVAVLESGAALRRARHFGQFLVVKRREV